MPLSKIIEEIKIGEYIYEVLNLLKDDENYITNEEIFKRAEEISANLGDKDCKYILANQKDIPKKLRDFYFIFTDWRNPDDPESVACVYWDGNRWVQHWRWLDYDFDGNYRFLRHKPDTKILSTSLSLDFSSDEIKKLKKLCEIITC